MVLAIVAASVLGLPALRVPVTGQIPSGLPSFDGPALRLRDVEGILPLAAGCLLLAYIESVSAARTFAAKHGYPLDPRQEFLGLGAANFAAALGHGYPVAGGLSQSAVNDQAGARTPLALVFASIALAFCLLFLTGLLENLPKAVLAAIVLTAIFGLFDFPALLRMWRVSPLDFRAAATALIAVLLLGILQGILFAALASILMLLSAHPPRTWRSSGRVPGTNRYSDMARHPENEPLQRDRVPSGGFAAVLQCRLRSRPCSDRLGPCRWPASRDLRPLSLSPSRPCGMPDIARVAGRVVGPRRRAAHCGSARAVRDLLRADGVGEKAGGLDRLVTLDDLLSSAQR